MRLLKKSSKLRKRCAELEKTKHVHTKKLRYASTKKCKENLDVIYLLEVDCLSHSSRSSPGVQASLVESKFVMVTHQMNLLYIEH